MTASFAAVLTFASLAVALALQKSQCAPYSSPANVVTLLEDHLVAIDNSDACGGNGQQCELLQRNIEQLGQHTAALCSSGFQGG